MLKQDPNKPSAHIEGANHKTGVYYEANTGTFFIILVTYFDVM